MIDMIYLNLIISFLAKLPSPLSSGLFLSSSSVLLEFSLFYFLIGSKGGGDTSRLSCQFGRP